MQDVPSRLDIGKCTNPPWKFGCATGQPHADLITAVANLAFDALFHYRCSL